MERERCAVAAVAAVLAKDGHAMELPGGAPPATVDPGLPRCKTMPSWKCDRSRNAGGGGTCSVAVAAASATTSSGAALCTSMARGGQSGCSRLVLVEERCHLSVAV